VNHGLRSLPRFAIIALLAFGFVCASGSASARHRHQATAGAPGDFTYYLLSLSWSPAFCLSSPDAPECNGPRRYGFIVHGLWPQNEQGWPENCDVHRTVPDDVVRGIADVMPARNLIYHEWSAHGTCSGLEPAEFFALVRRAYAGVAIPHQLSSPAQALEQPPIAIADAFLHTNPRLMAEDAWNTRDPVRVALAYTADSRWRNRAEFLQGRDAIQAFLTRKWSRELDYRLIKELWAFRENRIAVRFAYEWHDDSGHWYRSYGNENWEFDEHGLMRLRIASINDLPIAEDERRYRWPLGRRPDDHPSLSDLGL
jgi:nuclear transport factor 2 (NTF2) superfamily protein